MGERWGGRVQADGRGAREGETRKGEGREREGGRQRRMRITNNEFFPVKEKGKGI